MEKRIYELSSLVAAGELKPDDFYVITITPEKIVLQGKFSPYMVAQYRELVDFKLTKPNGYITGLNAEATLDITLT